MIEIILGDHQHFHSDWQCDYLITVRSGGTLYGCYKQAVRELHKRWRGLRDILSTDCPDDPQDAFERDSVLRDTKREFLRFYGQAIALRRSLGLADGQAMPDELRDRLDVEMWEYRIRSMAAVDFLSSGRLQRGTLEMIQCCPVEMRRRLVAEITDPGQHQTLIDWWMSYDPGVPAPLAIPETEARRLLQCASKHSHERPAIGIMGGSQSSPDESSAVA